LGQRPGSGSSRASCPGTRPGGPLRRWGSALTEPRLAAAKDARDVRAMADRDDPSRDEDEAEHGPVEFEIPREDEDEVAEQRSGHRSERAHDHNAREREGVNDRENGSEPSRRG